VRPITKPGGTIIPCSALLEDWAEVLTPEGRERYEELRGRFERDFAALHFTYERARSASDRGDFEAARQLLEAAHEFVIGLAPERERMLRDLARYTRMLGAIAALPPLRPAQFQLPELATLASAGWLAHHFLVTVPERLRLRLGILRRSHPIVLRALRGASLHTPTHGPLPLNWARIDAARADWSTLDRESLQSFGSLLTTLFAAQQAPSG
jgi:hypothetical protein